MASNAPFDDEDQPLTPEQEKAVRRVWRLVTLSGVIIAAGFALVFVTILTRLSDDPEESVSLTLEGAADRITLSDGEDLVSAVAHGRTVTAIVQTADGRIIRVFDAQTLEIVREISVEAE